MSVGRTTELTATSTQSFEDALQQGLKRAQDTLRNVKSCWVKEQEVLVGDPNQYKVTMKVTFVLDD